MELRSTEKELEGLRCIYESLRIDDRLQSAFLPQLRVLSSDDSPAPDEDTAPSLTSYESATRVLQDLECLRDRLKALKPTTDKFRKRLSEKDPITDAPRFGASTKARVKALLSVYDQLHTHVLVHIFKEVEDNDGMSIDVLDSIRRMVKQEELDELQRSQLEEAKQQAQEEIRLQEKELRLQAERKLEEQAHLQQEQDRLERKRQLEESLLAQERERRAADQADREWISSITKGVGGVKEQLNTLLTSTKQDPEAQRVAIAALQSIFSQIVAHPEETNFRRIRRDHPKFTADIGRWNGGKEILIAAGFDLGAIDDVPSYVSKEPDIEKDMDGWASWYDLLKATVEIIEQQMRVNK